MFRNAVLVLLLALCLALAAEAVVEQVTTEDYDSEDDDGEIGLMGSDDVMGPDDVMPAHFHGLATSLDHDAIVEIANYHRQIRRHANRRFELEKSEKGKIEPHLRWDHGLEFIAHSLVEKCRRIHRIKFHPEQINPEAFRYGVAFWQSSLKRRYPMKHTYVAHKAIRKWKRSGLRHLAVEWKASGDNTTWNCAGWGHSNNCAPYAQMVARNTERMGCAINTCGGRIPHDHRRPRRARQSNLVVCVYGPKLLLPGPDGKHNPFDVALHDSDRKKKDGSGERKKKDGSGERKKKDGSGERKRKDGSGEGFYAPYAYA